MRGFKGKGIRKEIRSAAMRWAFEEKMREGEWSEVRHEGNIEGV